MNKIMGFILDTNEIQKIDVRLSDRIRFELIKEIQAYSRLIIREKDRDSNIKLLAEFTNQLECTLRNDKAFCYSDYFGYKLEDEKYYEQKRQQFNNMLFDYKHNKIIQEFWEQY